MTMARSTFMGTRLAEPRSEAHRPGRRRPCRPAGSDRHDRPLRYSPPEVRPITDRHETYSRDVATADPARGERSRGLGVDRHHGLDRGVEADPPATGGLRHVPRAVRDRGDPQPRAHRPGRHRADPGAERTIPDAGGLPPLARADSV